MALRRVVEVLRKYDPAEWGGTETHVAAMVERLARLGWRPEVHAPAGPSAPDRALPPSVPLVRYRSFAPFLGSAARRRALIANAGNIASLDEPVRLALDGGIALAHVHTLGRIGGAVRTAMRWTGRPYVVSIHGPLLAAGATEASGATRHVDGVWDLGRPLGALLGARRVLDDAARVIVFNDEERDRLSARIGVARVARMRHGVAWRRFADGDASRARARWPELGDAPLVAMVARVATQKNQALAVRAFARGAPADHRLVLAGATVDAEYRAAVEREARAAGVAERVHFLGNLEVGAVVDLLACCRLVLVPSTWEAFGLSVIEAWSASRPVLFARRFGLEDIARELADEAPALRSLDEAEWSGAIARWLGDEALRAATAKEGHALARTRYDLDGIAGELDALYREVLAEPGAGRRR